MRPQLIVLKLVLDYLDISSDITTVEDRKLIQKTIYLLQALGGNLNYNFRWYKMGPYSTDLTADYYRLNEVISFDSDFFKDYDLSDRFKKICDNLKSLFSVPKNLNFSKENWLELLSSIHFLMKINTKWDYIKDKINSEKKHLIKGLEPAKDILKKTKLI